MSLTDLVAASSLEGLEAGFCLGLELLSSRVGDGKAGEGGKSNDDGGELHFDGG